MNTHKLKLSFFTILAISNINMYGDDIQLDEVYVTANKQKKLAKDVKSSITVIDEYAIEDKNINKVSDITAYIPNFTMFQNGGHHGVANPSIRGISALSPDSGVSVPIIIDGVAVSSALGYDSSLYDIQQIEVLRGPQGTLYGVGAEAGVINITTKKPSNHFEAKIGFDFGNNNKKQYNMKVSGPIVENKLFLGISGSYFDKDGYIKNTISNKEINHQNKKDGRVNLIYNPNDDLSISLISAKTIANNGANNMSLAIRDQEVESNIDSYHKDNSLAHALNISYNMGEYILEAITTHRKYNLDMLVDGDLTQATKNHAQKINDKKELSQEVRLKNTTDKYSWILGAYGADKNDNWDITTYKPAVTKSYQEGTTKSYSAFANLDYNITEKFGVSTGIRYEQSKKSLQEVAKNIYLEDTFNSVSPTLSLNYKIDKNHMLYTTISKGYNSGGFNTQVIDATQKSYGEEELISYELGLKSSYLDNRVTMSSAIYSMDITNLQVQQFISANSFYLTNAAKAKGKGFELEIQGKATEEISLFANYGYNKTTFDEYSDFKGNYKGNYKPLAPKYNYSLGFQYRDSSGYYARTDVTGYGDMYLDNANKYKRDSYSLVNAKLGYESEKYDIYLYGKNIFDKDYSAKGFSNGVYTIYSDPSEFGIQLAYRF